jgi:predicted nucleic acid-binding protein
MPERFSEAARGWLDAADMLLAPDLLSLECANALWKKTRLGELTLCHARSALERIVSGSSSCAPRLRWHAHRWIWARS